MNKNLNCTRNIWIEIFTLRSIDQWSKQIEFLHQTGSGKPSPTAAQAKVQMSNYYITTFLQAALAIQSSFDMTWQEVQKALVATFTITGFWYILSKMTDGSNQSTWNYKGKRGEKNQFNNLFIVYAKCKSKFITWLNSEFSIDQMTLLTVC